MMEIYKIILRTLSAYLMLTVLIFQPLSAQDKTLLTEKPGTFKFRRDMLNGLGPDYQYRKTCNFTNTESEVALNALEKLVQVFRNCPVLKENKGFDAIYDLGIGRCNSKYGYPVPSTIAFYLSTWSLYKGKEVQWTIEPPQWRLEVNMTDKYKDNGFNETDFSNASGPTNPAFSEEAMSRATAEVNELFYQPGVKEAIKPGIDRYGEIYVIYNPDRPPYWQQVTIREAYRLLINYWKCIPEKAESDVMVSAVQSEFNRFSEAEKDRYAYFGDPESVYRIGYVKNDTPVLRPNPEYWNKTLPRSAIQIMVLEIPGAEVVKNKMNNCLQVGDG